MVNKPHSAFYLAIILLVLIWGCKKKEQVEPLRTDTEIETIVHDISPDSIKFTIHKLVGFYTRNTLSDTTSDTTGIGAARRWIAYRFKTISRETGGRLQVRYDSYIQQPTRRINRPVKIVNVIATLPGSQPGSQKRIYIVSGHYDSRISDVMDSTHFAPGADDDGSGVAASIELARVMAKHKFDATIMFVAVAGEEQGLFGSTHLANEAKDNNWDVAGMITNDIIGNPVAVNGVRDAHEVRVFASGIPPDKVLSRYDRLLLATGGENDTPSRELARHIRNATRLYVRGMNVNIIYRNDRYLRGGDHMPFLAAGYAAVRFTEPHENYRHQHQDVRTENGVQYGDLARYLDYNYIANVTRINAAALATLAQAPASPTGVVMETKKLTNNTTLKWNSNHEPDLAWYRVVWRNTNAPYWEYAKNVGTDTVATIDNTSKDNYIFGVEAVDKGGHRSPAVYPLPEY